MSTEDRTPDAAEIAQTGLRLMLLTHRALVASGKMQAHSLAMATGAEYALMDSVSLAQSYGNVWAELLRHPQELWSAQLKAGAGIARAWTALLTGAATVDGDGPHDRRFKDRSWSEDPASRMYRDVYLAFEEAVGELLDDLDQESKDSLRVKFYTRQALSALSPANFLATNAGARNELIKTHGESLLHGIENLLDDLEHGEGRLAIATNDRSAFEVGKDLATTEGEVVFQNELMQLIQYHPRTDRQHAIPFLFVPAWINKFYILDMQPKNSLIRYMLDRGHSVFVISWVNPTRDHADMDFADYMTLGPLAALDAMRDITRQDKANVLGFCIGGILVIAMLAYLAAMSDDRINSATTLATLVDFEDVGEIGVFVDDHLLDMMRGHMAEKGYLEAHNLQDMFSMLRENDLIWSFYEANYLRGHKPRPFDLLYWNADSTRLPAAMLLWYLEKVYLENRLRQPGGLELNGVRIDISKITTPCFIFATHDDHIAPWRSIYPTTGLLGGEVEFVLGGSGHIAGVINPPSPTHQKYGYRTSASYPEDPEEFLARATQHEGSWWPYWAEWIEASDGQTVAARKPAKRGKYKSIEPAPGSYVRST
ncbi:alpha/beta hydrolase [Tropicimonas sp. IMCC6043]|uniref:PHA/PHB synthase family protein n=1 Tax=Tropicimonas sp. IMCC6043 TaxID=2510645 RepID=UPI0013EA0471|nr:class I poly(R)-hydroxyalkanoic acid synthase [Tropicimonas sp. IMCC6043]